MAGGSAWGAGAAGVGALPSLAFIRSAKLILGIARAYIRHQGLASIAWKSIEL